jgi:hypothetical protein
MIPYARVVGLLSLSLGKGSAHGEYGLLDSTKSLGGGEIAIEKRALDQVEQIPHNKTGY